MPVIDVGFAAALKRERIVARPNIARFTSTGVAYIDGRVEGFDVVIAATGYRSRLPQLLDLPGALDAHGNPRFPSGRTTSFPGLYVIGYTEACLATSTKRTVTHGGWRGLCRSICIGRMEFLCCYLRILSESA